MNYTVTQSFIILLAVFGYFYCVSIGWYKILLDFINHIQLILSTNKVILLTIIEDKHIFTSIVLSLRSLL